tara:strand:+ start:783 stop:1124 length:342 start_codon:yes stop_codon:yes gene_type:complete
MNATKAKAIRRKSYQVLYDWIRFELLSEEERNTMKPVVDSEVKKDMMNMIPKQTHYFHAKTLYLSAWTLKWVQKKIKGLVKKGYSLEDIDYTLLLEKKTEAPSGLGVNTGIQF